MEAFTCSYNPDKMYVRVLDNFVLMLYFYHSVGHSWKENMYEKRKARASQEGHKR